MTNFGDTLYFKMEMLLFLFQILFLAEIFSIDQIMKWLICSIDSLRNADLAITKYEVSKNIITHTLHTDIVCFRRNIIRMLSNQSNGFTTYLLIELTLGTLSWEHTPSANSLSRISQANMVGLSFLYLDIVSTTWGVATFGLLPPMTPALKFPVS